MPGGARHTRRQRPTVILATPVPPSEPTTVTSVTIEDSTTELRNKVSELREANEILGERLRDLIDKNNKLVEHSKKVKKIIDKKTKRIDELEKKIVSDSIAIKKYQEKIKELMNEIKVISERNNNLELSSRTIYNLHRENKEKCISLVDKLNKVRKELPLNFDKEEWNNKHFVNFLIDLTLEDIMQLKF